MFDLFYLIGYFLFMIIFMIIAIATAKSKASWIWYSIGAIMQLLSLSGNQKTADYYGSDISMLWFIYFALLIICAIVIAIRYNDNK